MTLLKSYLSLCLGKVVAEAAKEEEKAEEAEEEEEEEVVILKDLEERDERAECRSED